MAILNGLKPYKKLAVTVNSCNIFAALLAHLKTQEKLHKNVNENMFSFTFYANFHASLTSGFFVLIFMKLLSKCGNDIHHFGKVLLVFELRKGLLFGLKSGLGKSLSIS